MGAGLGGLDRTGWMGTGLGERGRGSGGRTGYISGGTTYLPHSTPCRSPVGPLLKENVGHAGHSGECGVPIWGPFYLYWGNTHVFCGCVFGGCFLTLIFNNIFELIPRQHYFEVYAWMFL